MTESYLQALTCLYSSLSQLQRLQQDLQMARVRGKVRGWAKLCTCLNVLLVIYLRSFVNHACHAIPAIIEKWVGLVAFDL